MDGNYVLQQVHDEFAKRMESENQRLAEEDKRQNMRIAVLEENVKEIHSLTLSVERMAVNMENMLVAIERQGNLIEKQNSRIDEQNSQINEIKNAPVKEQAKDSKQIKMVIITAAITTVINAVVGAVLMIL